MTGVILALAMMFAAHFGFRAGWNVMDRAIKRHRRRPIDAVFTRND